MADISYSRTFQHVDWIDNEDVIQAGGENGFNRKFHDLEAELDKISTAVTSIKAALSNVQELADGVVTTPKLADNAVTVRKIAANTVTTANIARAAVTRDKIAFFEVKSGSGVVAPGGVLIEMVQDDVENAQAILYLPMMTIVSTSGEFSISDVEPAIVYQHRSNEPNIVDVLIRFTNRGPAQARVVWSVSSITTAFVG